MRSAARNGGWQALSCPGTVVHNTTHCICAEAPATESLAVAACDSNREPHMSVSGLSLGTGMH